MIGRKKRPRKLLPAARSAANSCTQTDTMACNYRRPRPSLYPAMPATLQVGLPAAGAVAIPRGGQWAQNLKPAQSTGEIYWTRPNWFSGSDKTSKRIVCYGLG
jgi:hypothetical protein